jgi:diadenylate cyclase
MLDTTWLTVFSFPQTQVQWVSLACDLVLVYICTYYALVWVKKTHYAPLIRGLFLVASVYGVTRIFHLNTFNWMLDKLANALILIVIIIFQPELRRFLERMGSGLWLSPLFSTPQEAKNTTVINQILKAVHILSKEKIGALIAIEVSTNLEDYIASGIPVNSTINAELVTALFWPKSPTHDGAVIIRESRIEAAGCLLPLTDTPISDRRLGTRHRAAIGLSQLTDALVIVVSEETGIISLAENGNLMRYLTREALETRLFNLYREDTDGAAPEGIFKFFRS